MTTPIDAATEAAKAVQEVAKTGNTVVQVGTAPHFAKPSVSRWR